MLDTGMVAGLRGATLMLALLSALAVSTVDARAQVAMPTANAQGPIESGVVVDSIIVRGNDRVPDAVVRVTSALTAGSSVTALNIQNAIRRLMSSGNFEDVRILSEGDPADAVTLIIEVEERPFIAYVEFQGLDRISESELRDTIGIEADQPLDPNVVTRTEAMIRDMLARAGVQVVSIDTSLAPVDEPAGAYSLTFNVREGNRLSIAEIEFEGNEAFSDDDLEGAMGTKEEGFLWFRSGRFDRATFQEDLQNRLPTFYGEHGYIDFAVVSDTLIVDPESGKARLEIAVAEGPQYRLGEFTIEGASRFPSEELELLFTSQRRSVLGLPFGRTEDREAGEVFDRAALDAATERVAGMYRNQGYLYAQVLPQVERVPAAEPGASPTVDVTWAISEHTPFYISRVTIAGNTYTHESVIRERILVLPGDVYNEDRLLQSYQSISALGFFETPMPLPDINPDVEGGTVDIVFYVDEKQTGSIQFGTSIGGGGYGRAGGLSGFLGYNHPNLFGQAKQADLRAEYGYGRSSFSLSYTDPNLFGTRNSASVSLFHTDDRWRGLSFSEGRYMRTGGSLRYGFPLMGMRWTRVFAGYSLSRYSYEAANDDQCEGNIFCQPSALASNLSLAVTRDTKNHPLFPTAGTRQNFSIDQTGGPLGGDGNFQKVTADAEWWVPIGSVGGGTPGSRPILFTFGLQTRGGALFGDASRFPLNRFYLGGTQWGIPLRGYEESEITPLGFFERGAPGIPSQARLGNAFVLIAGEAAMRLNDNISLSVFADAGNIWSEPSQFNPTRLFRSVGIGTTIVTPFGPLGLDYAYGFDKPEPGWMFHFKINAGGN
jgi:outer membrane protein insertion porin family